MWGIHNDVMGTELVDQGFISIGWEIGDLARIGRDRSRIKDLLQRHYPNSKPGAFPVWAGVLHRFAFEMEEGDLIVAPYKPDSTLNFGVVEGPYEFHPEVPRHQHRRRVEWVKTGVPRGQFSQSALYEIGSAITLFHVRKHAGEFKKYMLGTDTEYAESSPPAKETVQNDAVALAAAEAEPNAERIDQHTRDFIVKVLHQDLSHQEFEEFTADLLRAMGYQARVTTYSGDGGVDVLAHKDALGLEPPLIKVQCKHTTANKGQPDVQQLIGTLADGEVGLFVTLGNYSKDATSLEQQRRNLRLFGAAEIQQLVLDHYDRLPAKWRQRMPLRPVLVVDQAPESQ